MTAANPTAMMPAIPTPKAGSTCIPPEPPVSCAAAPPEVALDPVEVAGILDDLEESEEEALLLLPVEEAPACDDDWYEGRELGTGESGRLLRVVLRVTSV